MSSPSDRSGRAVTRYPGRRAICVFFAFGLIFLIPLGEKEGRTGKFIHGDGKLRIGMLLWVDCAPFPRNTRPGPPLLRRASRTARKGQADWAPHETTTSGSEPGGAVPALAQVVQPVLRDRLAQVRKHGTKLAAQFLLASLCLCGWGGGRHWRLCWRQDEPRFVRIPARVSIQHWTAL
jgi:hypothetical protein